MDIAIQFEKINLGDDRFLFKPLGIMRGNFYKDEGTFVSECGVVCYLINGDYPDEDNYFSTPTNLTELKKAFGNDVSEEALLTNYLSICLENCYIGVYDDETQVINVMQIPFDNIDKLFDNEIDITDGKNSQSFKKFVFDVEALKSLRNLKSLKEVREKLDSIINISNNSEEDIDADELCEETPKKLKLQKEGSKKFSLKKLRKTVLSRIIAQDEAVNTVTTALAVNYTSKNPRHKSHILIAGPSGTGKTEMINIIANHLNIPYFKADATAYTKEGYVGKSVYSMLTGLIDSANGDIEKAQNGILIIDEIDKKAIGEKSDVGGQAVLNSLLKIMDRGVIELNTDYYSTLKFDTSNLTIIFMGAFADLFDKKKKDSKKTIGFGISEVSESSKNEVTITNKDLIDYGMTSEFIGRIGTITYTNEFSIENLVEILYKSKISPLKEEKEYFEDLGVKITFTSGYIKEIASMSIKAKTGARDLKNLVKQSLKYAYDDVLLDKKVKTLRITKQTVKDPKKYYVE